MVSLKNLVSSDSKSIILDNLTLSSAARIVALKNGDKARDLYPRISVEIQRSDKWNYEQNYGFRFGVDLACLTQLVEAIILFENITVDEDHLDRWGKIHINNTGGTEINGVFKNLNRDKFVTVLHLSPSERFALIQMAYKWAEKYINSEAFREYLHLLSKSSTDVAFINISHAYFETGYSDTQLFPLKEINDFLLSVTDGTTRVDGANHRRSTNIRTRTNYLSQIEASKLLDLEKQMRSEIPNLLGKTSFHPGDVSEKHDAGVDIMKNAIAALFYKRLAELSGLPYMPHPLRSSFIAYEIVSSNIGRSATLERIVNMLEQDRISKSKSINNFYKSEVVQLKIPFFLALVLEKANSPDEIIDIAFDIRKSNSARAFRGWIHNIEDQIQLGNYHIEKLAKEIKNIEDLFDKDISNNKESKIPLAELGINIGPISVSSIKMPKPLFRQIIQPNHIRFLQNLANVSNLTPKFEKLITKAFGPDIAMVWSNYRVIQEKFHNIAVAENNLGYNPLKKRG